MLRHMLDRLRHRRSSVQYEVQRRTFRGGWKNYYAEFNPNGSSSFETPPEPLDLSEPTSHTPGAYRCIKRVDGHINSVVWARETADAESYYEERRRAAQQQARLEKMSPDEIGQELDDGDPFDALKPRDVWTEVLQKQVDRQVSGDQNSENADTQLRDSLLQDVASEEGPHVALDILKNVKKAENGLCSYCTTGAYDRCTSCGELACRQHIESELGICHNCRKIGEDTR